MGMYSWFTLWVELKLIYLNAIQDRLLARIYPRIKYKLYIIKLTHLLLLSTYTNFWFFGFLDYATTFYDGLIIDFFSGVVC